MLFISRHGIVDDERVEVTIYSAIERGPMDKVNGIIVHQTNGPTASSTFNSYKEKGANGAHFLIDKDGTIYQTASVYQRTNHVGLLKSRCIEKMECAPSEFRKSSDIKGPSKLSRHEYAKNWLTRFPGNADSIGIELVGKEISKEKGYESVTGAQNDSLKWLVGELSEALEVFIHEIYKHPEVSYKIKTEASTAKW